MLSNCLAVEHHVLVIYHDIKNGFQHIDAGTAGGFLPLMVSMVIRLNRLLNQFDYIPDFYDIALVVGQDAVLEHNHAVRAGDG